MPPVCVPEAGPVKHCEFTSLRPALRPGLPLCVPSYARSSLTQALLVLFAHHSPSMASVHPCSSCSSLFKAPPQVGFGITVYPLFFNSKAGNRGMATNEAPQNRVARCIHWHEVTKLGLLLGGVGEKLIGS